VGARILGETYWLTGMWTEAIAAFERAWWAITAGWLAAALWQHDDPATKS
jgi:hypothetical protein